MLFSKEKWNDAEEIQPYLQTSSALSFKKCASSFQQAEDKYLEPMLGAAMLSRVVRAYNDANPSELDTKLVTILQGAEGNLAFYENFDEFQTRLTDQGLQRQETEKFKQAYRYQEEKMRRTYLVRGLNYLEKAMAFLDKNLEKFEEWTSSPYCLKRNSLIVRSASEISALHFVNDSPIIYLRLAPSISLFTELKLPKVIGKDLCKKFLQALKSGKEYLDEDHKLITVEDFRKTCAKYIIFLALADLVRNTGSVTDRGLYFNSQSAVSVNPEESVPGSRSQIEKQATMFDSRAASYISVLQDVVQNCFPSFYEGKECDVYKRDNYGKHTMFL